METYANLGGDSGVMAFEIGETSIVVHFRDGSAYLYNELRPGRSDVQELQRLARTGQGLNSYISTRVKKNFARKLR